MEAWKHRKQVGEDFSGLSQADQLILAKIDD
jgi:hypothetical protein